LYSFRRCRALQADLEDIAGLLLIAFEVIEGRQDEVALHLRDGVPARITG
jgi:hypothetical protein